MKSCFSILFLFIASINFTQSQELFLRTYDFGSVENAYQIKTYKGRLFISAATFCQTECSYLVEIDSSGTILWKTEIPDIDIASGSMIIVNDTITIIGNDDLTNTFFLMSHFSLDGEKFGQSIRIFHPTEEYLGMFHLTSQYFQGKFVICGTGEQSNVNSSLIYIVSSSGQLDTLIALEPTDFDSDIWDSYIDKEGRLTTYHQIENGNPEFNKRKIFKFDEDFNIVWNYISEHNDDNSVIPHGCELHDSRSILSFINPQGVRNIHSIRAINIDGSVDWQHNYPISPSRGRYILRLKTLSNGDIMGCGTYSEIAETPKIDESTWLFRMSPEGVLLWERTYFEIDTETSRSRHGVLFDFIELDNHDIIMVGYLHYEDDDMLIMRVDSNGCINPDDCSEVNILTSSENMPLPQNWIKLFPNPVEEKLYIYAEGNYEKVKYHIYNFAGIHVMSGLINKEQNEINVSMLSSGMYIVHIFDNGKLLSSKKFIKLNNND